MQSKSRTRPMATWLIIYLNGNRPNVKTFQVGLGSRDCHGREHGFEQMKDCCKKRGLLFRDLIKHITFHYIKKKDYKQ